MPLTSERALALPRPTEGHQSSFVAAVALLLSVAGPGRTAEPEQAPVFVSGREGYHTCRIPARLVTKSGTLLAFCEGRKTSRSDTGDVMVS